MTDKQKFQKAIYLSQLPEERKFWSETKEICRVSGVTYDELVSRSVKGILGKIHLHIEDLGKSILLKRDFHAGYLGIPEYIVEERITQYHKNNKYK